MTAEITNKLFWFCLTIAFSDWVNTLGLFNPAEADKGLRPLLLG